MAALEGDTSVTRKGNHHSNGGRQRPWVGKDVSRVHDFHGNAANPSQNGTLRHADINHVLSQRAQEKIDKYRAGYAAQGERKAFLPCFPPREKEEGAGRKQKRRLFCA